MLRMLPHEEKNKTFAISQRKNKTCLKINSMASRR